MTKTYYRARPVYHPTRLKVIMASGIGIMIAGISLMDAGMGFLTVVGPLITLAAQLKYEKIPRRRQPARGNRKIYNIDIITLKKEDCK